MLSFVSIANPSYTKRQPLADIEPMNRPFLVCFPVFFLSTLLACTGAGTARGGVSARTLELDGRQVLAEEVARERYQAALAARETGDFSGAEQLLLSIEREFSDTSIRRAATLALAQVYLDQKRPEQAQGLLESFLLREPAAPEADQARYQLALAQLAQGNTQDAGPALETLVERMPTADEKRAAALQLAEQLTQKHEPGEAARYLSRALELTDEGPEQQTLRQRLLDLVDREVSFTDVRRLKELEAKPGTFLDELLSFKLARIHVHLRDYPAASEAAEQYLARYPSGRFAEEAKDLVAGLRARVEVKPTTIGAILPLSGTYKSYGQRALTALKLGLGLQVDRSRYKGDDDGVAVRLSDTRGKLRILVRDSKGDPALAASQVEQLVEHDHVMAIVGDILLNTALPVALKAEEYAVPVLSLSRKEGVAGLGPWSFRVSFTAQKQAQALAALAMDELGMKRFAILYPRHSYGIEVMNAFWDEVEKRQGEVTAVESYAHDQTTFTEEAKRLVGRLHLEARGEYVMCKARAREITDDYPRKKALERCRDDVTPIVDFDALLIPDDYKTVSYIVPALVAEDLLVTKDKYTIKAYRKTTENMRVKPVQLLGGAMWHDPELGERLGRQIEGAVFVDGFSLADGTEKVTTFVKDFVDVHRSRPTLMEAQAFDAGHLLAAILLGQAKAPPKTRDELRDALATAKDFPGVTGLLRFDDSGDSATPPRFFMLEKGKIESADVESIKNPGEG